MKDALLEGRSISKYFGGLQAIDDVSFAIRKGEIFSVIGPNGAGKTTLFNLITAFLPPTRGEILLKGEIISGLKPYEVARMSVARTFQQKKRGNKDLGAGPSIGRVPWPRQRKEHPGGTSAPEGTKATFDRIGLCRKPGAIAPG